MILFRSGWIVNRKIKMLSPLLLVMLLSSTDGGTPPTLEALTQTSRVMGNVSRWDTPTLPVSLDSRPPLSRGTGQEPSPDPALEVLLPVRANASPPRVSVRTSCLFNKMLVQVQRSIMGSGDPDSRLRLGTCRASSSTWDYVYFEYDLGMCGTKRSMINNKLAYSNALQYDPLMLQGPIRRAVPFNLSVSCHYNRYQYSEYTPKMQLRKTFTPVKNKTQFILTPRNAQWERISPSFQYVLGRSMYFEAEAPAMPRNKRLYVHLCYATPEKSHTSTPQFPVVQNFGCMVESKDSRSRFVPYKSNAVRFSVDSFFFRGITNQQLYMHCSMSVGSSVPTPTTKSCNYNTKTKRWDELYGTDLVCTCCESNCSSAASTVTKIISSQPWTIDPKVKPSTASKRKKVSTTTTTTTTTTTRTAAPHEETAREVTEWTTTSQPDVMEVTLFGKVDELEWLFGGEGASWVEMEREEKRVTGFAVVEMEKIEKIEVTEPQTIFDEIFGSDE